MRKRREKEEEGRREHSKENRMISRVRKTNHSEKGAIEVGKEKVSRRGRTGASGRGTVTWSASGSEVRERRRAPSRCGSEQNCHV